MSATIANAKIDLRLLASGDVALYAALYGDPGTMAFVAAAQDPHQLTRSFASTCRANTATPPRRRTWVIHERGAARDLGLIGLVWDAATTDDRQGAELGVVLPPALQGRGIASAAIAALAHHAFGPLGLQRLHTRHDSAHGPAGGLMSRLGFLRTRAEDGPRGWRWELTPERWSAHGDGSRVDPLG